MHSIESYSKYLHQLIKENKFENVLINFKENAINFKKEEIGNNSYLVGDLLKCYREQNLALEGLDFLKQFEVDIFKFKESYASNQFGWLLHFILKNYENFSVDILDSVSNTSIDFLSKISPLEDGNRMLITHLFLKVISQEKRKQNVTTDNLSKLLKGINIKNEYVKNFIASGPYLVSGIMDIFRKSNHVERVFGFLKFLNIKIDDTTPEPIVNSYGWSLYTKLKLEISDIDDDESDLPFDSLLVDFGEPDNLGLQEFHPSNETLNLISNSIQLFSTDSDYSPFSKLFNLSLRSEKKKSNPNWLWMESFLLPFRDKPLSEKCETIQFVKNGREKTVELASDVETWHSYFSLCLLKQNKYQDCIDSCKKAFLSVERFHYNNELWFARKIAISNKGLGNTIQAIKEMEGIEKKRSEWFIQKELAELYFENDELEKAKGFAIKGALNFGEKEKKDGLYFLLGQIFLKKGDKSNSYKHFLLAQLIRVEQEWFVPNRLRVALEESFSEDLHFTNSEELYKDLLKVWKSNTVDAKKIIQGKQIGKIIKLNPEREIGTIVGKDGNRFFFRYRDFIDSRDKISINIQVQFKAKPPRDNQPGLDWIAYEIRLN